MKQEIIDFIKENPNADGIDIAHGLNYPIEYTYKILRGMCNDGKIEKIYHGLGAHYNVLYKLT